MFWLNLYGTDKHQAKIFEARLYFKLITFYFSIFFLIYKLHFFSQIYSVLCTCLLATFLAVWIKKKGITHHKPNDFSLRKAMKRTNVLKGIEIVSISPCGNNESIVNVRLDKLYYQLLFVRHFINR